MLRTLTAVAIAIACCSSTLPAQDGRVDTVLVLKTGQEIRGQFVGFRNGLFTLRLPDGRITIHGVGDVERMQPADAPSIPAPARAPVAQPAPAPAAPAAVAAPPPSIPAPALAAPAPTRAAAAPAMPAPTAAPPPAAAPAAAPTASAGLAGAALEAKACGPDAEKFPTVTDKSQHPSPGAPADKALVYVVRPGEAGGRIQTRLSVNGAWVGANYGNNYFFVTLDPGEHYFCSAAQDRSTVALTVEPGKIYYLKQTITPGMMKSKSSLDILADQDGREAVANTNLSAKREPRRQ